MLSDYYRFGHIAMNAGSKLSQTEPEVHLREATIDDVEAIARVSVNAWRFAYASFVPPEIMAQYCEPSARAQRIREYWKPERFGYVAVSGDAIVGFAFEERPASLDGFDAEIASLYVDPEFSRAGVGALLFEAMVSRFIHLGHRSMAIHTLYQNRIGRAFYEKHGGQLGPDATWRTLPSIWYTWPDLAALSERW